MKKKIFGILVCVLFITSIFTVLVTSMTIAINKKTKGFIEKEYPLFQND